MCFTKCQWLGIIKVRFLLLPESPLVKTLFKPVKNIKTQLKSTNPMPSSKRNLILYLLHILQIISFKQIIYDLAFFKVLYLNERKIKLLVNWYDAMIKRLRECWQLGFIMLNSNLTVNLKLTHPTLLNSKGQFAFLKTKSSH